MTSFALSGSGAKRELRLRAVISNAGFNLCERPGTDRLRGDAAIATDWYVETPNGTVPPIHMRSATTHRFDHNDAAGSGAMFQILLRKAADQAARRLVAGDAR